MAQWDRSSQGVQLKTVQARAEVRGRPGSKLSGRGLIQQPYTRISGPKWVGTDFEFQHRHQWIGQLPSRDGRVQPPISEQVWYHDDSGHGVGVCVPTIVLWMPFTGGLSRPVTSRGRCYICSSTHNVFSSFFRGQPRYHFPLNFLVLTLNQMITSSGMRNTLISESSV